MNSMTGFGRGEAIEGDVRITVEIKSVNHRFLDLNVRIPKSLMFLEEHLRNIIKDSISRGRLEVFVSHYGSICEKTVLVDEKLAKAYIEAAKKLEKDLAVQNDLCVSQLMRIPDIMTVGSSDDDTETLKRILSEATKKAVDKLTDAREREGKRLAQDMEKRFDMLNCFAKTVHDKEGSVIVEYRDKLSSRIQELTEGLEIDEGRLATELAYFADKQNVTEETVRVFSHVKSAKNCLKELKPQGRQLDFLLQELNREFNTIGSKSCDLEIINAVLAAKGEIEKIREQVQNIE